jgi:medium-chain acyl-[acyl-carrier-protein] hydrolase
MVEKINEAESFGSEIGESFGPADRASQWLFVPRATWPSTLRLICFPPAGLGAAVYRSWANELPAGVGLCAIQLPGRTSRFREPAMTSIPQLVETITEVIAELPKLPSVFFGHSMGAVLASEVTRRLAALAHPIPRHLIVSGRRPPPIPDRHRPLGALSDAAFVTEIGRRYGGIPPEILANPDVLELLLPSLRADIVALERYQPPPRPSLPIPISAFGGDADPMTPVSDIEAWENETQAGFKMRIFPGGHFYLDAQRKPVLDEIARIIAPLLAELKAGV